MQVMQVFHHERKQRSIHIVALNIFTLISDQSIVPRKSSKYKERKSHQNIPKCKILQKALSFDQESHKQRQKSYSICKILIYKLWLIVNILIEYINNYPFFYFDPKLSDSNLSHKDWWHFCLTNGQMVSIVRSIAWEKFIGKSWSASFQLSK